MLNPGSGTRLGPYEITGKLGQGGMGEVWSAHDSQLGRAVALKLLPERFVADPVRLARFEREAKLLAQLNHPNIAHIYGLERSGETRALVMELVEGPTLAERLEDGPLPLDEALAIARQIAEALEAAHEKGIVHRDLKPQNVKAAPGARVKVLDFGLAKALDSTASTSGSATEILQSPTLTAGATAHGMILGTAAYMAPEQARAQPTDKRADIWAFGVVLYEMLAGRTLFAADTVSDTLAAVLRSEIDLHALPTTTPLAIRQLLRRAIERDPRKRLHDIADARIVLDEVLAGESDRPDTRVAGVESEGPSLWRRALPWVLAVVAGLWALWATAGRRQAVPRPPAAAFTVAWRGSEDPGGLLRSVAASRDGRHVLISDALAPGLFVRDLDRFESRLIPATEGATNPFFSPDGAWIGFNSEGALQKVALSGGDRVKLCDTPNDAPGATWGPDGWIYYTPTWASGLWRVSDQGGKPEQITAPERARGETGHYWPSFLPEGEAAILTLFGGAGMRDSKVGLLDLESRAITILAPGAGAQYVASGHLVFFRHGSWLAVPFDARARKITGGERRVLADTRPLNPLGGRERNFSFADNGTLVTVAAENTYYSPYTRLAWIDRQGRVAPLAFEGNHWYSSLELAPDGRRAAVALVAEGEIQVWAYDLERGTRERLTRDGLNFDPVWRPDGARIAMTSLVEGNFDVRAVRADGGEPPISLVASPDDDFTYVWGAPGRSDLFVRSSSASGFDIWERSSGATGGERRVIATPFDDDEPALSPDGGWLAYSSDGKLYVTAYPEIGERVQVSTSNRFHAWSESTRELFYLEGGRMMALGYEVVGGRFRPLESRLLFAPPRLPIEVGFAVAKDAARFLFLVPVEGRTRDAAVRVRTDGFAELERGSEARP